MSLDDAHAAGQALDRWSTVDAAVVRFVHGGPGPVRAVRLARVVFRLRPGLPVSASFDTAFRACLPEEASRYALPREWISQGRSRKTRCTTVPVSPG